MLSAVVRALGILCIRNWLQFGACIGLAFPVYVTTTLQMALALSAMQSCGRYSSEKCLRSAIAFEAGRGYLNTLGRDMRFNNFLLSKISKLCYSSKYKFGEKLLEEVNMYETASISNRSKLLNKVSVFMGYNSLHDLIENEQNQNDTSIMHGLDDFDLSMACKKFPSIHLGSSPLVELYEDEKCENVLPTSKCAKWIDPNTLCERLSTLYPSLQAVDVEPTSVREENSTTSPLYLPSTPLENEGTSNFQEYLKEKCVEEGPKSKQTDALFELILDKSISCIPGLSKRQYTQLENCGFHTLRKLLHHFPRTYADVRNPRIGIDDGHYMIFVGEILSSRGIRASYSLSFLEVVVGCEITDSESTSGDATDDLDTGETKSIYLHLKKFFRGTRFTNQHFLKCIQAKYREGDIVCVSGKVKTMSTKEHYEMREYNLDVLEDQDSSLDVKGRPYPLYPSKGGLTPDFLRDIISRTLQALPFNVDPIPNGILEEFKLLTLHDAYIGIHKPKDLKEADLARKRLIFDEFFYLQLGRLFQMLEGLGTEIEKEGLLNKYINPELNAILTEDWSVLTKSLLKALPYTLTSSQLSAVSEIIWDLKRPVPMNRLLQGDVGCGKTVVAFLACMEVLGSGYQAAFMVPTELLAVQHYEHFLNLLEKMEEIHCKPSVALLTGSTPSKQARIIREGLQTGDISFVIGTHSLISEKVEFSGLRIAVVDEQHRFGVIQRGRFNSKLYYNSVSARMSTSNSDGSSKSDVLMAPHVLAMSATPIPRTLALALYGDMSLTQITDLPPGRIPVETCIIEGSDSGFENVYQMMLKELEDGGKVYLVYPVIEQSEQLPQLRAASTDLETISRKFENYCCGLLHGKMKSDNKEEALRRFRSGETRILLSTQVIEIGVDVPDASMMVVMNAERFGIAQLHQLRGRVGRGLKKSKCVLVASTASSLNRLKVLEKSSDGFHLANFDLILRGPGDLLGKKQSGHLPEFPIARLEIDGNILQEAHLAALKILGSSHDLEQFPQLKAELSMRQPLSLLGD